MKTITSSGKSFQVSDEDYDRVNEHRWYFRWSGRIKNYYICRDVRMNGKVKEVVLLSRFLLGLEKNDRIVADHINGDTLNNTRENLRIATWRENATNRKNKSQYGTGVQYQARLGACPYRAFAHYEGVDYHIGLYGTAEDARDARAEWLLKRGIVVNEVGSV